MFNLEYLVYLRQVESFFALHFVDTIFFDVHQKKTKSHHLQNQILAFFTENTQFKSYIHLNPVSLVFLCYIHFSSLIAILFLFHNLLLKPSNAVVSFFPYSPQLNKNFFYLNNRKSIYYNINIKYRVP